MRPDDHMRIGSITKTLTATIILELVDHGKVGLDDPVSKYLRGVPDGANISVRELLNMTSGLQNFTESLKFNAAIDAHPERVWAAHELLPYAFNPALSVQAHPYFPPNQGFHYSNTNYLLLGEIAEKVTDTPLNVLFQRRIFQPLGMTHSELPKRTNTSIPNPHPHGYNFGTNVDGAKAYFAAIAGDKANAEVKAAPGTVPHDATLWNTSYTWADGSAISTAHDLLIWAKALGTGRLLSASTQQQRVAFSPVGNYGLGIEHAPFGGLIGHNGAIPGFQSFMGYAPKTGSTVIVLANLQLGPNVYLGDGLPADALAKIIAEYKPLAGAL
jgi:D-alanyl-D-alanine carboxypeptidase